MLECRQLNYFYQTIHRLKNISFTAKSGEFIGLFGQNGAGKSTLLKMLGGSLKIHTGDIKLWGKTALDSENYIKRELRSHMGVLFQGMSSDSKLSAYHNLVYAGRLLGIPAAKIDSIVRKTLQLANLSARAHEPLKKFSHGMQRRLELYRTFMHKPKIVLLDEPTASLDASEIKNFFSFLEEFRRETKALILMSNHRPDEIMHCDRVLFVKEGSIISDHTPQALVAMLSYVRCSFSSQTALDQINFPQDLFDVSFDNVTERIHAKLPREGLPSLLSSPFLYDEKIMAFSVERPTIADAYQDLS